MLRKVLSTLLFAVAFCGFSFAQVGQGALKGKVVDKGTGEPLPFVNIILEQNGNLVAGGATDFDGKYSIKPVPPGKYDLKASFTGYKPLLINGIVVKSDQITFYDVKMESTVIEIEEFEVIEYTVPLISKDNTSSGGTVTREDIAKMPGRSAASVAETVGGVYSQDNGTGDLNVRGSRSDANYYYIDGIKVRGSAALPKAAIEQVSVITGGLPAQYGDVTGGIISVTTRGASRQFFGGIDYLTSGFKIGDNTYGLDPYGYNLLEYSLSGPLFMKKDSTGKKSKPLVGFFLAGNFTNIVDNRPSIIGNWKIKDDALDELNANPLRFSPTGPGTFQNAEFLRMDDFEKVRFRQNARRRGALLSAKLDINTTKNTSLTVGGSMDLRRQNRALYDYSLFNYGNNPERVETTYRVFARFTQRFGSADPTEEEKSASSIKNAYYTVQVDYNRDAQKDWDDSHKDNLFAYGYIGQFRTFQSIQYGFGIDSLTGLSGLIHQTFVDTLIGFEPSTINPEGARYTSMYYELYGWEGYDDNGNPVYDYRSAQDAGNPDQQNFFLRNFVNIQGNGGLRNGDAPQSIYTMWNGPATQFNNFTNFDQQQYRVSAIGSADVLGDHAITIGFEYEQRVDRQYTIAPRELWTIGRQLTNTHVQNLDLTDPTVEWFATFPTITYDRQNAAPGDFQADDAQTFFDFNLRSSLGLDPDGNDFIDFDSYGPDDLNIDMFSANELITYFVQGSASGLTYYGYDHKGDRITGNPSFDDFFQEVDQYGNLTRPVAPFRPIYMAGFIQDKFSFSDLVFNVGFRVDRFDANQKVLKDPYILFPSVLAGEAEALSLAGEGGHPSNIGEDYAVYVDNIQNPSAIVGYRDGDTWFNAEGAEIADPEALTTATGIQPLLVDKENTNSNDITSDAFEDYTPQTNFMPRIAFSFPISDEALFFAHYDVLTKRPTIGNVVEAGNRLNPIDYYQLQNISYTINNPNLRPEKTIDYEIGFQQKLTKSSSLKFAGFYREQRDMIQVIAVTQAYPQTYRTYGNLDFATIKGLTVAYDLRRTGNVWMRASYNLQFADGTGSSSTTALNLIRAGKANLRATNPLTFDQRHTITATVDYRFGSGTDYNGPIWKEKQILANTGANFIFNGGSGVPYSRQRISTPEAFLTGIAPILDGTINGSRLPWQFRIDAQFDKSFEFEVGKGEKKKPVNMNVYIQILNLLNSTNTVFVYRFTGNANDDGYLTDARYQTDIASQNDEQSFRELYALKINDYRNFALPRRTRLGISFNF